MFMMEDPADPFLHYALCLELKKCNPDQAAVEFQNTLRRFPDYLPLYYQAALFNAEGGNIEDAANLAARGILLAEKLMEHHALAELKSLRQNILAGEFD